VLRIWSRKFKDTKDLEKRSDLESLKEVTVMSS
jgi:hypothetical protein